MRFGGMWYLNIFFEINIEKREQCRADTKWARTKTFCFPVYSGLVSSTCPAVRSSTDISRLSFVKPLYFSLSFIVPSCFYSKTNMYALRKFPLEKNIINQVEQCLSQLSYNFGNCRKEAWKIVRLRQYSNSCLLYTLLWRFFTWFSNRSSFLI